MTTTDYELDIDADDVNGPDITPMVGAEEFSRRFQEARLSAGIATQIEASDRLGLSSRNYRSRFEDGKHVPNFAKVLQAVAVLGLDPRRIVPEWFPGETPAPPVDLTLVHRLGAPLKRHRKPKRGRGRPKGSTNKPKPRNGNGR
jgi:hypothetical protein